MTSVRRLWFVIAALAMAGVVSTSDLWGDTAADQPILPKDGKRTTGALRDDTEAALARSKFETSSVVTYRTLAGETLFALQLKLALDAAPRRPRDYLVLVNTSASQGGASWNASRQIAEAILTQAGPTDRVSLWTVSTPEATFTRCLTGNRFLSPEADAAKIKSALAELGKQYPAGDTDLQNGLNKALASFDPQVDRQRVILFLGDGLSTHAPLASGDRQKLARTMVDKQITFFPIPLGKQLSPENLHGLATGSGGAVVRVQLLQEKLSEALKNLETVLAAPVFYPTRVPLPAELTECYPSKLPPLRGNAPTLLVGKVKGAKELKITVDGTIGGQPGRVTRTVTEAVPSPEVDNYFLVSMVQQWKNAVEQHALIRADRALAFASENARLQRMELLGGAEQALQHRELDDAERLFEQARKLVPHDAEAKAGVKIVSNLRSGAVTWEKLRAEMDKDRDGADRVASRGKVVRLSKNELVALAQVKDDLPAKLEPNAAPKQIDDLLQAHRDRIIIEEQKINQTVEAAIRQAKRQLSIDPEGAREMLRGALGMVRDNPDIGENTRDGLMRRLETNLRDVSMRGQQIVLLRAQQQQIRDKVNADIGVELQRKAELDRNEARFRVYRSLMTQGRFERFTEEKVLAGLREMQLDALLKDQAPPVATQAAYSIVSAGYNLEVQRELRRKRELGFLAVMLEVEKSHIPFADEPPIHFPPLATWKALYDLRKARYEVTSLPDDPQARMESQKIAKILDEVIDMKDFQQPMTLKEALGLFVEKFAARNIELPILVDSQAFKEENPEAPDIYATEITFPPFPRKMALATALRLALGKVATNNATYMIRRNYIEITTIERQTSEKALRVYPVGDLVIPISSPTNPFMNQGFGNAIGGAGNGFGMTGMPGMMMGGGMNVGMMMGGGMNMGMMMGGGMNMGAMGMNMGAMGMNMGMGAMGMNMGAMGMNMGAMGMNMGAMGMNMGAMGMNMGAMGMNMGMGMGMQMGGMPGQNCLGFNQFNGGLGAVGSTMDQGLILLIQQVVAPGEWGAQRCQTQPTFPFGGMGMMGGQPGGLAGGPLVPTADGGPAPDIRNANTIGFYAPALALVVRGKVAGRKGNQDGDIDPAKVWQEALTRGVQNPGLIVATADFLFENEEYEHAVEFLKANLRQGIVVRPWVYEALAVAMEAAGTYNPEEIRRAQLSAVSLDPTDADGYLKAAQTLGAHKQFDRAVAFCKQAASLEPNMPHPYANALAFAEMGKNTEGMEWAVTKLLSQEWPNDNRELHLRAQARLETLAATLNTENRKDDADRLRANLRKLRERDLVINLTWEGGASGQADLDLLVKEPGSTVCSSQLKMSPGGGTMICNSLTEMTRISYVASQAFSGDFEITVRRLWGQPLGGKARLEIIQHQGTAKETRRIETIHVAGQAATLKITLADGRRTDMAVVPPPAALQRDARAAVEAQPRVLEKLRDLADPMFTGRAGGFRASSAGTPGGRIAPSAPAPASKNQPEALTFQSGISDGGLNLNAQAQISADQRYLRLSLTPMFHNGAGNSSRPLVSMPLIPGGGNP